MKLKLNKKLLEQRELLQRVSQLSYTYSQLNNNYKGGNRTDEEAEELIAVYDELLEKIVALSHEIESEMKNSIDKVS